jgi:hypothetical protein
MTQTDKTVSIECTFHQFGTDRNASVTRSKIMGTRSFPRGRVNGGSGRRRPRDVPVRAGRQAPLFLRGFRAMVAAK